MSGSGCPLDSLGFITLCVNCRAERLALPVLFLDGLLCRAGQEREIEMPHKVVVLRWSGMGQDWVVAYQVKAGTLEQAKARADQELAAAARLFCHDTIDIRIYGPDVIGDFEIAGMYIPSQRGRDCMQSCPEDCQFRHPSNPF